MNTRTRIVIIVITVIALVTIAIVSMGNARPQSQTEPVMAVTTIMLYNTDDSDDHETLEFNEDGLIVNVPMRGEEDPYNTSYGNTTEFVVSTFNDTNDFQYVKQVLTISGTDYSYQSRGSITASISFEDAALYYNQRVVEGDPIPDVRQYESLQWAVLMDVQRRIDIGFRVGNIPAFELGIVDLPTIAYDEEVQQQYLGDKEAIALREQFLKDPSYYVPPLDGRQPYYEFGCADYQVGATNWDQVTTAIRDVIGNDLVVFTPSFTTLTLDTELPCVYVAADSN